jgi:hypothetical protein
MYVKITKSGPRQYIQIVESFRTEDGRVKNRTIASLGRLDQIGGDLASVIRGLSKIAGNEVSSPESPTIAFEFARSFGDVWALNELWHTLGFDQFRRIFRQTRHEFDIEACLRVMVFNRLCDPDSKLGVLRWLETVTIPQLPQVADIQHQHLLRSMDALIDHQAGVDNVLSGLLRPLIDQELSMVFYDLTTIRAEGSSELAEDIRRYGMSKEGVIAKQFMLGIVQTADGLPIYHQVLEGNTAEAATLVPTVETILKRFPFIRRLILVADRGLLSLDNIETLKTIRLKSGEPLEFIMAVPGRRYCDFADLLDGFHEHHCQSHSEQESTGELAWQNLRLIVAHDPVRAALQKKARDEQIDTLIAQGQRWSGKLDEQDSGLKHKGRKLSDAGAAARFYHAVVEARLSKIIQVDLKSPVFNFSINQAAKDLQEKNDGKLLIITNVQGFTPVQIIERYKALADIERGFRVLKSELEIGPIYHRLPDRIRAHAAICFMALIIHRVMRMRLRAANNEISPDRALELFRRIQYHQVKLNSAKPVSGLSSITSEQADLFKELQIKKPVLT